MIGLLLAMGGYYLAALAVYAVVKPPADNPWYALIYTAVQLASFMALLYIVVKREGYGTWRGAFSSIYSGRLGPREAALAIALWVLVFTLWWPVNLLYSALGLQWGRWGYSTAGINAVPVAIWALGAAFFEEAFFRGYSISRLAPAVGNRWAALLTSAAFSAVHLRFGAALAGYMFLWGLVAAALYIVTKSTWACLLYHMVNNVVVDFFIYGR
ncbi:CPBP family intramembrane glutamic endopeptidase [Pyrobaculum ferrireducens]|uniref:Abortive infection protein n=1 Tax=Pyrobaculum ferrireducens TaxID=1104324 RepID=G7VHM1_9CREN|nr:type II CAAX endopeptidase family protein [Pyrobaculum ferrireducens]AET33312.1 Abortive infection protein [Pyrobaculum ferrireducens]